MADTEEREKGRQEEPSEQDYEVATEGKSDNAGQGKRDMGTVGGGNIPGRTESDTSDSLVKKRDSVANENTGAGVPAEGGSVEDSGEGKEPAATNTIDKQAHSSSGGRHPSQPQTAMGDQDATQGRSGDEVTEPMSSRAPDKIKQKQSQ